MNVEVWWEAMKEVIEHLVPIPDGSPASNTALALSILLTTALVVLLSAIYRRR